MVTAHESAKENGAQSRWDLLAGDAHSTLIGYMGVTSLPRVVERLLDHGMDPETPAAMVERGTTSRQKVVRSSLAGLPDEVKKAGIQPPALFVIGPSVAHADKLDWFGSRPLFGERIALIAPGRKLADELEINGAEVLELTLPVSPAARVAVDALPLTGCLLKTADEVDALEDERGGKSWGTDVIAWCLSREAGERARQLGWGFVRDLENTETETGVIKQILEYRAQQ
jgi:hypothetical protein